VTTTARRSAAWRKVDRATWHRAVLDQEMLRFFSQEPEPVVPDEQGDEVHLQLRVPLPDHWSLILGDCLQNLRSALEHIARELALDHSPGHNPRRVAFPIADTEDAWLGRNGNAEQRRYVSMMSPAAQAAIEQLQPFNVSPARPDLNVLWKLHELARIDRHQTVHLFVQLTVGNFTQLEEAGRRGNVAHPNPYGVRFITAPISVHDLVISEGVFTVDSQGRRVRPTPSRHIAFDVAFDPLDPTAATSLVSESLQLVEDYIRLDVLPPLEALLS
jgi:hypothetical protein